jgi:hypothetical protein
MDDNSWHIKEIKFNEAYTKHLNICDPFFLLVQDRPDQLSFSSNFSKVSKII